MMGGIGEGAAREEPGSGRPNIVSVCQWLAPAHKDRGPAGAMTVVAATPPHSKRRPAAGMETSETLCPVDRLERSDADRISQVEFDPILVFAAPLA